MFEFSPYNEHQFDTLAIDGDNNSFFVDAASIIKVYFEGGDAASWASAENPVYQLVYDDGLVIDDDNMPRLVGNFQEGMFDLAAMDGGLYLIGHPGFAPEPGSGVPEPSTWALLILGAVGLLYMRKRNK